MDSRKVARSKIRNQIFAKFEERIHGEFRYGEGTVRRFKVDANLIIFGDERQSERK